MELAQTCLGTCSGGFASLARRDPTAPLYARSPGKPDTSGSYLVQAGSNKLSMIGSWRLVEQWKIVFDGVSSSGIFAALDENLGKKMQMASESVGWMQSSENKQRQTCLIAGQIFRPTLELWRDFWGNDAGLAKLSLRGRITVGLLAELWRCGQQSRQGAADMGLEEKPS